MDLSEQTFLRLLDLVYAAAEDPRKWREFYSALTPALGVKSIHMVAIDKSNGSLSYSDGDNLPTEGELAYMHHYRRIDPRNAIQAAAPEGKVMHYPAMLAEDVVATHPIYQEFLIPYDRHYCTQCNLVDTPQATVLLSTLGGEAEGPLSAAAEAFLDRLVPHLQRACRIGIRAFVYSHQALVGNLLVSRLRQPVILMTAGGNVMHSNEAAQELLRHTSLVQVKDGMLRLPKPSLDELLRRCRDLEQSVRTAGPGADDAMASASQFQSLRVEHGMDAMYAFFTMLTPQREMGAFGLRPLVMLLFYHPDSAPGIDASLLYAVFGLTPAEARVAIMLAEGLTLKEIAAAQGIQHDTVRKQLGSIYLKTSTNRQPELVRLLLHLPQTAVQDMSNGPA